MTKDELFEIFDKYDTYEFRKEGESIHGIKWADLNGLADELVKLFAIPVVTQRSELLKGDYKQEFTDWKNKYFAYKPKTYDYKSKNSKERYTLSDLHKRYEKAMLESPFNCG